MNKTPLVSVILPTYNRSKYLARSIESVLSQSYNNFELVVIDDASKDNTQSVISQYQRKDYRVKIIRNKANLGFVKSLNKAINYAQGKYIARIDDDDLWCDPKKLEKQIKFLEDNPEYILIGCGGIKINEDGKEIKRFLFPEKDEDIRKTMLFTNSFIHVGVVYSKKAWEQVKGYDEVLYISQDSDLWAKLGKIGKMYNIRNYCVKFLQGVQSRTSKNIHKHILLGQKVRKRYRKDYPYFYRAYIMGFIIYFISFLPFQRKIRNFLREIFYER